MLATYVFFKIVQPNFETPAELFQNSLGCTSARLSCPLKVPVLANLGLYLLMYPPRFYLTTLRMP